MSNELHNLLLIRLYSGAAGLEYIDRHTLDKIVEIEGLEYIHKHTLNKIVEIEGDCLRHSLCNYCPFKATCLPDFLDMKRMPSRRERYEKAADALARAELMLDFT